MNREEEDPKPTQEVSNGGKVESANKTPEESAISTKPPPAKAAEVAVMEDAEFAELIHAAEEDRSNPNAWAQALDYAKSKKEPEWTREVYERVLGQFPLCGDYWLRYIEFEMLGLRYARAAKLFGRCLVQVLDVDLFVKYVEFVRRVNAPMLENTEDASGVATAQANIQKAFDFAIVRVGVDPKSGLFYDPGAGRIFLQYLTFLKAIPRTATFGEAQRVAAVREVYQAAIVQPIDHIVEIWGDYVAFEEKLDPVLAAELRGLYAPKYMAARVQWGERKYFLERLQLSRHGLPRARSGANDGLEAGVRSWREYLDYELGNPQRYEPAVYVERMAYVYEQALGAMYLIPEIWQEAAQYLFRNKGFESAEKIYQRGSAALPTNMLLHFLYASFLEENGRIDEARARYEEMVVRIDQPLVHIQRIRAEHRMGSMQRARAALIHALRSPRCTHHVYLYGARMELFVNHSVKKALAVLESGMARFGGVAAYVIEMLRMMGHVSDVTKMRSLYEQALQSLPVDQCVEVWNMYLEYEFNFGGLAEIAKLEERRANVFSQYRRDPMWGAVHRFRAMDLWPVAPHELQVFGARAQSAVGSRGVSTHLVKYADYAETPDFASLPPLSASVLAATPGDVAPDGMSNDLLSLFTKLARIPGFPPVPEPMVDAFIFQLTSSPMPDPPKLVWMEDSSNGLTPSSSAASSSSSSIASITSTQANPMIMTSNSSPNLLPIHSTPSSSSSSSSLSSATTSASNFDFKHSSFSSTHQASNSTNVHMNIPVSSTNSTTSSSVVDLYMSRQKEKLRQ